MLPIKCVVGTGADSLQLRLQDALYGLPADHLESL